MEYLVTAEEMKQYDANTIDVIGVPGMVLMERAALGAFSFIEDKFSAIPSCDKTVLVMVGMGNNGGDGLALARLLSDVGCPVDIQYVGDPRKASEQWKLQKKILEHYFVGTSDKTEGKEYTIMVDALFGVGLSRNIEGEYAQAVEDFNKAKAFKLALDIPSGICSDTGKVLGCAVCADVTVTFGFRKRGLMLSPGETFAGEVVIIPIGITEKSFMGRKPELFYYDEKITELLPKREKGGNKGTFGKLLLIAGSPKMAGAAVLAAKAAYRSGAGMVKVITSLENRVIIQSTVPEALFGTYEDMQEGMKWADVIAIGPGLGRSKESLELLKQVLLECRLPMVIDADGLNLLAEHAEIREELTKQGGEGRQIILTPHVGELSRLTKHSIPRLKENLLLYSKALAKEIHAVVVAKDARTYICGDKDPACVNLCGNSGMATAGSGDVLTGVIAGLLTQGMDAFSAAAVGVYLHAKAGDAVAANIGEHACMARDICEQLHVAE
ncbi:MAG: NAD(P)H-hydrate dehydratase [Lachnospiraceae bacterium]|nr:NAD(P)H-hydrate dehydratase [Lachnospiraceae bacterium]